MKTLITLIAIISLSLSASAQNGYSFSTSSRGSFTNKVASEFEQVELDEEQTNIYDFSFTDKMLVHHIVYSDKSVCQFYKITKIDVLDEFSYYIEVTSGASGSQYYYYLSNVGGIISFYQLDSVSEDDKFSGTRFGGIGVIKLITFEQE